MTAVNALTARLRSLRQRREVLNCFEQAKQSELGRLTVFSCGMARTFSRKEVTHSKRLKQRAGK